MRVELVELEPRVAGGRADRERPRDGGAGRTPLDVGRELAKGTRKIFKRIQSHSSARQSSRCHPADSVLGALSRWPQRGLAVATYDEMIKAAFHEQWWHSNRLIRVRPGRIATSVVDRPDDDPRHRTSTR